MYMKIYNKITEKLVSAGMDAGTDTGSGWSIRRSLSTCGRVLELERPGGKFDSGGIPRIDSVENGG